MPFALPAGDAPPIPDGFDTIVRLPLRDDDAVASVRTGLAEVAAPLLLALPALDSIEITVDGTARTLTARRTAPPQTGWTTSPTPPFGAC
ncbi:hypothetical protein BJF79_33840 [Actinomadura sp. CNU-125]|uniref:hypothetical protein n=1 Tax=Actinomadura sp. CNU-125 TaxID=1904961 RepID=UPI0009594DB2|nr:hypothetical protein [Actinomadura sp. CNU-125]OLT34127.1 hypothetical protein BJF79_33840 [Actinomadura sp. CNU-125]